MRTAMIAANWKMNGTRELLSSLTQATLNAVAMLTNHSSIEGANGNPQPGFICEASSTIVKSPSAINPTGKLVSGDDFIPEVVLFPAYPYLSVVHQQIMSSPIQLGAQNVASFQDGAYTGEVSATMLKDLGCRYVLLGHSERRHIFAESNEIIYEKFKRAQEQFLIPMLCVGETLEQRESGKTESIIADQLQSIFPLIQPELTCKTDNVKAEALVVAYEPVWAIGTGKTATPEMAEDVHAFIREQLVREFSKIFAERIKILYGGSVKAHNSASLLLMPNIDGALVGGASLIAEEFAGIIQCNRLF